MVAEWQLMFQSSSSLAELTSYPAAGSDHQSGVCSGSSRTPGFFGWAARVSLPATSTYLLPYACCMLWSWLTTCRHESRLLTYPCASEKLRILNSPGSLQWQHLVRQCEGSTAMAAVCLSLAPNCYPQKDLYPSRYR